MTSRVARGLTAVILMTVTTMAVAQHFPSDGELLELIRGRVEEGRATGIALGVLEADGSRRVVSYGDAGPGARPLGEMSVFEIGSISKAFTGILLADMVADGEVALDDPVAMYLPDRVKVPVRGREMTLLDLATHHSGLPRPPTNMSPADPSNPYADYTVEQLYAFLSGYSPPRDVGAQFEYSNLGGGLLGHVLSRVTFIGFDPEEEIGVVVLTNSTYSADDIGMHLINPAGPPRPSTHPGRGEDRGRASGRGARAVRGRVPARAHILDHDHARERRALRGADGSAAPSHLRGGRDGVLPSRRRRSDHVRGRRRRGRDRNGAAPGRTERARQEGGVGPSRHSLEYFLGLKPTQQTLL